MQKLLNRRWRWIASGLAVLALFGCKFGSNTPVGITGMNATNGGFLQLQSTSGVTLVANFGTLTLRLVAPGDGATPLVGGLLGPPGRVPTFTSAYVTVALDGAEKPREARLSVGSFDDHARSIAPVLSRLPASEDATIRGYLTDASGGLVGTAQVEHVKIKPGANVLDVPVVAHDSVPRLLGASSNINVSDRVVVKGAALTLHSGVSQQALGVSRVEIEISGPAYAKGRESALVASLEAPALEEYTWLPLNSSANYLSAKLEATNTKTPFFLSSKAIDPFGHVVATSRLELAVLGTAYVDVGFNGDGSSGAVGDTSSSPAGN